MVLISIFPLTRVEKAFGDVSLRFVDAECGLEAFLRRVVDVNLVIISVVELLQEWPPPEVRGCIRSNHPVDIAVKYILLCKAGMR